MIPLTIAIPVYKRPELLFKNLCTILDQWPENFEVLIVDDSLTDTNEKVLEKIFNIYPCKAIIRIVKNEVNLGIDENIKKCISESRTKYVWLLGEDDLLTEGAIEKVLYVIRKHSPIFIFVNYIYCNDDHSLYSSNSVIGADLESGVISFDDFLRRYIYTLGFIGACVIDRERYLAECIEKYKGSYYSHVGGIVDYCIGSDILLIKDVLVLNRAENSETFTWSTSTFDVYFSFYKVLELSKLKLNLQLYNTAVFKSSKLFSVFNFTWIIAKRADGIYNHNTYLKYYHKHIKMSSLKKILFLLISFIPVYPLSLIRRIHLYLRFKSADY